MGKYRRRRGRDYKKIILVGYDLDALLVRKVYLLACGVSFDAPVKWDNGTCFATPRRRVRCIQRIILLAGTNCGCRVIGREELAHLFVCARLGVGLVKGPEPGPSPDKNIEARPLQNDFHGCECFSERPWDAIQRTENQKTAQHLEELAQNMRICDPATIVRMSF